MAKGFDLTLDSAKAKTQPPLPTAIDAESVQQQWQSQFAELADPRGRQGVEHPFLSIMMIAILATIGGATGWEDIETYAESHQNWLSTLFSLPNGVPHADTNRRLFERSPPPSLKLCSINLKAIV